MSEGKLRISYEKRSTWVGLLKALKKVMTHLQRQIIIFSSLLKCMQHFVFLVDLTWMFF